MQPWCRVTASSVGGRLPTAGISVRQVTATPAPGVGMPMYAGAGSGVFLLLARTTKNEESPGAIRGARVDGSRTCAAATAGRRQGSPQARCRRGEPGPPELLRRGGVGDSVAGLSRPEPGSLSYLKSYIKSMSDIYLFLDPGLKVHSWKLTLAVSN
jgi:hypothetical protein